MLAVFLAMAVMVFSLALYADSWFGTLPDGSHPLGPLASLFGWLACGFATPVVFLLGWPLLRNKASTDDRSTGAVNALLVVGVLAAYGLSVAHLIRGEGAVYFETATMILVLVTLGRFLDAKARYAVSRSLRDFLSIDPEFATRLSSDSTKTTERVSVDDVARGDTIRVASGERVPADGVVLSGSGSLDESMLTGESDLRPLESGSELYAGSLLLDGSIDFEVRAPRGERLLDRMHEIVDSARDRRMPLESLSERAARLFLPVAATLAVGTFALTALDGNWDAGVLRGLAVLLVACTCALGSATPLATWVAIGTAAKRGILIRGGDVFEALSGQCRVFLDKTGTLTERRQTISEVRPAQGWSQDDVLRIAASLAEHSRHPVSRSIIAHARAQRIQVSGVIDLQSVRGLGLRGTIDGKRVALGTAAINDAVETDRSGGELIVTLGDELVGTIAYRETVRADAAQLADELKRLGTSPRILTGDAEPRAELVANELGLPVVASLLPTEKVERLSEARAAGHPVVMIGDGLNDAPVLAAADVAIALGHGAELSREVSEVIVLEDDAGVLSKVSELFELSRRTVRRVRFNLFWAFAYNTVAMVFAAIGTVPPLVAALLMILSSLFVIAGSAVGVEKEAHDVPETPSERSPALSGAEAA